MKSLEGHLHEAWTYKDVERFYRTLGRTIVHPSEVWIPLRPRPDIWGKRTATRNFSSVLQSGSPIENDFGPAWDRLEAQVGLCLSTKNYGAAIFYIHAMLGFTPTTPSIVWEGQPNHSRMWVRQTGWVAPIPTHSATESVLHLWWCLSGGFHNYARKMLPWPTYPLSYFAHYWEEDIEALTAHPSKTVWRKTDWTGLRPGENLENVGGVLYDDAGDPVRASGDVLDTFAWEDVPDAPCGLQWLDASLATVGLPLHKQAREWRLGMAGAEEDTDEESPRACSDP